MSSWCLFWCSGYEFNIALGLRSLTAILRHIVSILGAIKLCLFLWKFALAEQYLSCPDWRLFISVQISPSLMLRKQTKSSILVRWNSKTTNGSTHILVVLQNQMHCEAFTHVIWELGRVSGGNSEFKNPRRKSRRSWVPAVQKNRNSLPRYVAGLQD